MDYKPDEQAIPIVVHPCENHHRITLLPAACTTATSRDQRADWNKISETQVV
jgi:hypothetical protein